MTGNPATELRIIFEAWDSRNGAAYLTRKLHTDEGMSETVNALRLLDSINSRLGDLARQGRNTEVFCGAVNDWFCDILHFNHSWRQEAQVIRRRDMLEALELLLDSPSPELAPDIAATMSRDLDQLLQDVLSELKDDDTLDPFFRKYLVDTLGNVRGCLERYEDSGIFDLVRAIKDLEILLAAAQSMSRDRASAWQKLRERISTFTANPTIAAVAGAIATTGATALLAS